MSFFPRVRPAPCMGNRGVFALAPSRFLLSFHASTGPSATHLPAHPIHGFSTCVCYHERVGVAIANAIAIAIAIASHPCAKVLPVFWMCAYCVRGIDSGMRTSLMMDTPQFVSCTCDFIVGYTFRRNEKY